LQSALEAAVSALVHGPSVDPRDADAFLARYDFSEDDRAALRAEFERLLVYRRLVRGTLREAVELAIPRTIARLGAVFDAYFDRFLAERGPRTHYLRDVTTELLDFCAPLFAVDARVPAWAHDLARHEALQIVVSSLRERVSPRELAPLELERGLCFVEAARVARYAFAVHRLPSDEADRTPPVRERTALFVYRDPEHDVRYLELSPLAAALLERLLLGETLKASLLAACAETETDPAAALDGTARLLAELAARGALLGAAATHGAGTQTHGAGTQTHGAGTQTLGAEPATHGAEPATHGAGTQTHGAEPATHGAEPATHGAEPATHGLRGAPETSSMRRSDKEPHERS
jgi:hypothetical protein